MLSPIKNNHHMETELTIENTTKVQNDPWHDDALNRGELGNMLEKHILAQTGTSSENSLTIALDGQWGSGKTFFVNRWAKFLKEKDHGVVMFDAWSHDYASDPTISFMAEMRTQLSQLLKDDNSSTISKVSLTQKLESTTASLKKVAVPVGRLLAGGIMKKLLGTGLDELQDAFSPEDSEETGLPTQPSSYPDEVNKALDLYLDQLLQEHTQRKQSITQFRIELHNLVEALIEAEVIIGPLFVIIDELDRCRPDFAIRLLEGIKHIFNVKNVVFIFATNAKQLSAAMQAVYGPSFNGRDYLGRFFDLEVLLPKPTAYEFATLLDTKYPVLFSSQPSFGELRPLKSLGIPMPIVIWSMVSDALSLSLRQQEQARISYQISCQEWGASTRIPGLWLIFLSALHRSNPDAFLRLQDGLVDIHRFEDFRSALEAIHWNESQPLVYEGWHYDQNNAKLEPELTLSYLIFQYYRLSRLTIGEAYKMFENPKDNAEREVYRFIGGGNSTEAHPFYDAYQLISSAGAFSASR